MDGLLDCLSISYLDLLQRFRKLDSHNINTCVLDEVIPPTVFDLFSLNFSF